MPWTLYREEATQVPKPVKCKNMADSDFSSDWIVAHNINKPVSWLVNILVFSSWMCTEETNVRLIKYGTANRYGQDSDQINEGQSKREHTVDSLQDSFDIITAVPTCNVLGQVQAHLANWKSCAIYWVNFLLLLSPGKWSANWNWADSFPVAFKPYLWHIVITFASIYFNGLCNCIAIFVSPTQIGEGTWTVFLPSISVMGDWYCHCGAKMSYTWMNCAIALQSI